jgi:hypothetical protein
VTESVLGDYDKNQLELKNMQQCLSRNSYFYTNKVRDVEYQAEKVKFEVADILLRLCKINCTKSAGVTSIHQRLI